MNSVGISAIFDLEIVTTNKSKLFFFLELQQHGIWCVSVAWHSVHW